MTTHTHHTDLMQQELALATHDLSLKHGDHLVARGVTIQLKRGSITLLRGANGSGKTTFLRTLAGLREPASGTISISDGTKTLAAHRRRSCVFFGHDNALKSALTVSENLQFWRKIYGTDAPSVDKTLEALHITHLANRRVETLSAGQKKRTGFCRVLLSQKSLWLLDEPTASMDTAAVTQIQALITTHKNSGGCIFVATHEPLNVADATTLELAASA